MSSKNKHIIILLSIALIFSACEKTEYIYKCQKEKKKCYYAPQNLYPRYSYPVFKYGSDSELMLFEEREEGSHFIIHYDLNTRVKTDVVSGFRTTGIPTYSSSGWILFSDPDWKIWKVFEDGSGLEQITYDPQNLYPSVP